MKKRIIICIAILLLLAATALLAGCNINAKDEYDKCADEFFGTMRARDYDAMYSLFSPAVCTLITKENVAKYYTKVYDMLDVTGIETEITETVQDGKNRIYNYNLILHSASYGVLHFTGTLTVAEKLGFYLIEWTPANVITGMDYYDGIYYRTLRGERGEIFDCNGKVLVKNDYAITVYFDLNKVKSNTESANALAQVLQLDAEGLVNAMVKAGASGQDTVVAATYIPGSDVFTAEQESAALAIDGVRVDRSYMTPVRRAVYGQAAAHLIGYSTVITDEDRAKPEYALLPANTRIGRTGIEAVYDELLRGTNGAEIYLMSSDAKRKTVLWHKEPISGQDVMLTIDMEIQLTAEEAMQKNYSVNGSVGSVIVNDPATGAVKAIANYPSYNLNLYAAPTPKKEAALLLQDESLPLLNRATQGLYPPGSVFKTFSAIAGIETGTVGINTVFPYEKEIVKVSNKTEGWRPEGSNWSHMIIREHMNGAESYGVLDMDRALIFSDNIYFGWMGMKLGADNLIQWCKKLGIGGQIPFELYVKASQISNDEENLKLYNNPKFLADTSHGMGELLITPLQMSATYCLYGNNGTIMQPYCVQSINVTNSMGQHVAVQSTSPQVYKQTVCSQSTIDVISQSLARVTTVGTGRQANVSDMRLICKTGTAQKTDEEEIGWIACYVAQGGLNYSVTVCADTPKDESGTVKCATAKAVFLKLRELYER